MSYILIQLDEDPGCEISELELRESGFIPAKFESAVKDPNAANHVLQALEWDGADIKKDDDGIRITITPMLRERYFRHWWDEFQRWMERASKMDFKDFSTYHGEMKFNDAERWFKRPNNIYVWYAGWYSTLTEFLRGALDNETFYIGTVFELR